MTEKALEKIYALHDAAISNVEVIPKPDEFGQIKMSYNELKKVLAQQRKISWSSGASFMLAAIEMDNKQS